MTDRMSNVEIEDVLSSIRRLVSDELRPMPPLRQAAARLVLTPALRVDPLPLTPAERVADPEPTAGVEAGAADVLVQPERRVETDTAGDPPDLALRLAELELLLDAQDQPFEAEAIEDLAGLPAATWPAEQEPVPEAPFITDEDPVGLADLPDTPPPDWRAEAVDRAEVGAVSDDDQDQDGDTDPAEHAVLRALIRDVLREELQGAMGERVTRNLRKMVRSELARALAARGLT